VANIYYRTVKQTVSALDPANGSVRWTFSNGQGINTPLVAGNLVYVQVFGQPTTLYALDSATGAVVWSAPGGYVPLVADGAIYVIVDQTVACLDAATGAPRWRQQGRYFGRLTIAGDTLLVTGTLLSSTGAPTSSTITAINRANGAVRWSFSRDQEGFNSPFVGGEAVYFVSRKSQGANPDSGRLYALKMTDGSQLWSVDAPALANAFALGNGTFFAGGSATGLFAFRASDGALMWKNTDYLLSSFAAVGDTVYVNSFHNTVFALNATSGKQLWEAQIAGPGYAPRVANGLVYVAAGRGAGKLVAINASTGAISWQTDVQGTPGPPLLTDGMVYSYSSQPDNGPSPAVYAFNATTGARMWTHETGQNLETTLAAPDALTGA
jgi:outer membrane protein assembly factor BamB